MTKEQIQEKLIKRYRNAHRSFLKWGVLGSKCFESDYYIRMSTYHKTLTELFGLDPKDFEVNIDV